MPKLIPNLWFDTQGLEAAEFYCSIFPTSRVTNVTHYNDANPEQAGQVVTVEFELDGQPLVAINGGPQFTFDEAVSLAIPCADQAEADRYYDKLVEGGEESACGWLKDRYGFSWQVYPVALEKLLNDPDPARAARATTAMYGMKRIDLAAIEAAADAG